MQVDRYQRPQAGLGSLTGAATITGGMIAALVFMNPGFIAPPVKPFEGINIPADPPKPPPPPERVIEQRKTVTADPVSQIEVPKTDPIVQTENPIVGVVEPPPLPPVGGGVGTGVTLDPPAPPLPVLVAAMVDSRYAGDFQPPYPPSEQRAGNEARITVKVLIGIDGRVKAVEQVSAGDESFFATTRRHALARWRFKPATRDGVPYESWRTMNVRFVLDG